MRDAVPPRAAITLSVDFLLAALAKGTTEMENSGGNRYRWIFSALFLSLAPRR
jgi:hypothetical protein